MKLRNKKTGEVGKLHCDMNVIPTKYGVFEDTDIRGHYWEYGSLAELNEDWEDYKPAEPLIKDDKVRKAVRAWAELHGVKSVRYATYTYYTELANLKAGSGSNGVYMDIVALPELEGGKYYTIAELCGEEEE